MISYKEDFYHLYRLFIFFGDEFRSEKYSVSILTQELRDSINGNYPNTLQLELILDDFKKAESTKDFNWKELAKETQFYEYSEGMTNEEVFLNLQILAWPVIFPEKTLTFEQLRLLRDFLFSRLPYNEWVHYDEIVDMVRNADIGLSKVNYDSITRLILTYPRRYRYDYKHEVGSMDYFFKLKEIPDSIDNPSFDEKRKLERAKIKEKWGRGRGTRRR
jgi:hypothetical protein